MVYWMKTLVWLVFVLYQNYMSHPMVFPMSHLRTTMTRNQTKFLYIFVLYGHVIVLFCFPLQILHLVDLQELVAHYSYKHPFHIFFFCSSASSCAFLICLFYLQTYSWRWWYFSPSWVPSIASLWCNTSSNPSFAWFINKKSVEACGCLFFSGWDQRASLQPDLSNHPLLRNHSNQEHDYTKLHPLNPELFEQLVELIIHSVFVRRLSNWEFALQLFWFCARFLEDIQDWYLLLIFVW